MTVVAPTIDEANPDRLNISLPDPPEGRRYIMLELANATVEALERMHPADRASLAPALEALVVQRIREQGGTIGKRRGRKPRGRRPDEPPAT